MVEVNTDLILRGSEAPKAMICPGSVHPEPGEILIDSFSPAGHVGTTVHAVAKIMVEDNMVPDIAAVLQSYGLTPAQTSEAYSLAFAAWDFWQTNGPAFGGGVHTEYELKHENLSAHLDILSMPFNDEDPPDVANILDWKTTRLDLDYTPQLLFYAWLVILNFPKIQTVKTVIVFLRDRTANIKEWAREQIEEFGREFDRKVRNWDGVSYTPGSHCSYCRRFTNCPARQALVRSAIAELEFTRTSDYVEFYERVKLVDAIVEKAKTQIRAIVEQAGGELQGNDGKNLKLVALSRDKINAALAWPIIAPILTREELAECVTISKTEMLKAVSAHAPRGQKKTAKDAVIDDLKAAKAITTTEFNVLRVVQATPETKEIEI